MSASRIALAFRRCLAGLCALVAGCTSLPATDSPQSYIDESSAATITAVGRPLVFARERPNFAVHMRDYITLAAAAVNRSGKIEYVLITYFWSTFDPHAQDGDAAARQPDELIVVADDRRITLVKLDRSAHEVGVDEPADAPRVGASSPTLYHTDPATIRFIAAAQTLSVRTRIGDNQLSYEIWQDGRASLTQWLRHLADD